MIDQVQVDDLVGLDHESGQYDPTTGAIDCLGVAMAVLERADMEDAADYLRSPIDLFAAVLGGTLVGFECVGEDPANAERVGDLLVTLNSLGEPHISALWCRSRRLVVTSSSDHGCLVLSLSQIPLERLVGVYRWSPACPD